MATAGLRTAMGVAAPVDPARPGRPHLLGRGRCLRPLGRPSGCRPSSSGRRRAPRLEGTGGAWEWTSSDFRAYPGFEAFPYKEYSEVFFGDTYKVLRGSSWATHPHVARPSFRNWDLPQRRQIFAGLRLAGDA